jgi:hypothetical protein
MAVAALAILAAMLASGCMCYGPMTTPVDPAPGGAGTPTT